MTKNQELINHMNDTNMTIIALIGLVIVMTFILPRIIKSLRELSKQRKDIQMLLDREMDLYREDR